MQQDILIAEKTADYIIDLYTKYGDADYIGEPVSQWEHMCQAAMIAEEGGFDEEIVLAAFFHDIGHFCEHFMKVDQMDGYGVVDHEGLGAAFLLELGFSEKIASLVRNHVAAKRYLTYRYPEYYENLSEASKQTLAYQGGVMSSKEAAAFESDPYFELHIMLRRWDEKAKVEKMQLPLPAHFHAMIIRHLEHAHKQS
jgi:2-amino-1-hydroxyethylphosphonate dioxygenase (glycine-forming)